jgi:hypothetical protein
VDVLSVPEAVAQDLFGISMAADDDTLVVGAQFADEKGEDSGLAYVFERREPFYSAPILRMNAPAITA